MSNVLIGIIGVILFIGLSLAGALYLGGRFQDVAVDNHVAAISTAMEQVANATNLYRLNNGVDKVKNQNVVFLKDDGFLKAVPSSKSPYARTRSPSEYLYQLHLNNDAFPDRDDEGGASYASFVSIGIGPATDGMSRKICQKLADRYQNSRIDTNGNPTEELGCSETYNVLTAFKRL
jgi:hypothetical protein